MSDQRRSRDWCRPSRHRQHDAPWTRPLAQLRAQPRHRRRRRAGRAASGPQCADRRADHSAARSGPRWWSAPPRTRRAARPWRRSCSCSAHANPAGSVKTFSVEESPCGSADNSVPCPPRPAGTRGSKHGRGGGGLPRSSCGAPASAPLRAGRRQAARRRSSRRTGPHARDRAKSAGRESPTRRPSRTGTATPLGPARRSP